MSINLQTKSVYKNIKEQKVILDTFIIPLYHDNIRIAEIHFAKTGLVIGGCCYISRRELSRDAAKRLLQSGYAERLGLIKEAIKSSEI